MLSDAPDKVRAELRGPSGRLTRASLAEVFASLDLSGVAGPGEQTFTLSSADFSLPQGVDVLARGALAGALALRPHLIREVPVTIRLKGTPPAAIGSRPANHARAG